MQQTGKEKAQAFVVWARSHHPTALVSDEAISRATMYPDRAWMAILIDTNLLLRLVQPTHFTHASTVHALVALIEREEHTARS